MTARLRQLLHRIAALFRRDALDRDLDAEISSHLDEAIADNLRSGMTPQEARRQAHLSLGGRVDPLVALRYE